MKVHALVASAVLAFAVSHLCAQPVVRGGASVGSLTAPATLTIELTASTVTVRGLTPHGTAVIYGVLRLAQKYWTGSARLQYVVTDDDGDGVVQVANVTIPPRSVWFAAEIATGSYTTSGSAQAELRRMDLPGKGVSRTLAGEVNRISVPLGFVEGLVVRPGVGAWGFIAGDGGQHDADGVIDGRVEVDPQQMWPIGSAPAPPHSLLPHDILVIIDPHSLQLFASEVEP